MIKKLARRKRSFWAGTIEEEVSRYRIVEGWEGEYARRQAISQSKIFPEWEYELTTFNDALSAWINPIHFKNGYEIE